MMEDSEEDEDGDEDEELREPVKTLSYEIACLVQDWRVFFRLAAPEFYNNL